MDLIDPMPQPPPNQPSLKKLIEYRKWGSPYVTVIFQWRIGLWKMSHFQTRLPWLHDPLSFFLSLTSPGHLFLDPQGPLREQQFLLLLLLSFLPPLKGSPSKNILVKVGILTQSQLFKTTTIQNGDFVGILYNGGSPAPTKKNHQSPIFFWWLVISCDFFGKKLYFFMNKYYAKNCL